LEGTTGLLTKIHRIHKLRLPFDASHEALSELYPTTEYLNLRNFMLKVIENTLLVLFKVPCKPAKIQEISTELWRWPAGFGFSRIARKND
jgi:hypothetical protein